MVFLSVFSHHIIFMYLPHFIRLLNIFIFILLYVYYCSGFFNYGQFHLKYTSYILYVCLIVYIRLDLDPHKMTTTLICMI